MKKFYVSHLILCLFLISFGAAFSYFIISRLIMANHFMSIVAFVFYIPALFIAGALPLYAGIKYLISIIRGEDEPMYPTSDNSSDSNDQ